jgi:hypothetical protein
MRYLGSGPGEESCESCVDWVVFSGMVGRRVLVILGSPAVQHTANIKLDSLALQFLGSVGWYLSFSDALS